MVKQEDFAVEKFMDAYETGIKYNLGETCCYSLSMNELAALSNTQPPTEQLLSQRLIYGWIKGSDQLRDTVADVYSAAGLVRDDIVITNGAIGANFLTMYGLVGKGDHVIVVDPTYQQLQSVPQIFDATVDLLHLKFEESFQPNLSDLKALIKKNTKLIVINNPNNPTGVVIPTETLEEIVNIAKEIDAYVLCDEVYRPLFHSLPEGVKEPKSIVELYEKGISTCSVSKAYSFAGIRLGWIASKDKHFVESCLTRRDYNIISISMIDDIVANWVLQNRTVILERNYKLCLENLALLEQTVNESNGVLSWVKPQAGTTALVKVNGLDDSYAFSVELAEQYNTLVVPGEVFNNPGYFRVGFGNSLEDLTGGLNVFKEALRKRGIWKHRA